MTRANGRIACILNANAGSSTAEAQKDELEKLFAENGADVEILLAPEGSEIPKLARKAVSENYERILAGGGDGTINAVASALIGSATPLGVLPLGTLNHFAKDLKIPLALKDAVANALTGRIVRVDVGKVNDCIFLNNSSLGFYPGLVVQREALQRGGLGKWSAFARALISSLARYSALTVRLELDDDRTVRATTPLIFVGNNRYQLAAPNLGERAALDEGKLWVYQAPHAGRARLLWLALRALVGLGAAAELHEQDNTEFWIHARARTLRVATDGEVTRMATPLHYRILPGALAVIVPETAPA